MTQMDSFINLTKWLKEVRNQTDPDCIVILVGNKKDKVVDIEVPKEKAQTFVQDHKLQGFFETSARNGENVE